MRLTGKYYYLNILSAAAPLIGAITMANMDQIPRWTDWIVCVPNGIGIGSNVTVLLIALLANVDREDMAVGKLMQMEVLIDRMAKGQLGQQRVYLISLGNSNSAFGLMAI